MSTASFSAPLRGGIARTHCAVCCPPRCATTTGDRCLRARSLSSKPAHARTHARVRSALRFAVLLAQPESATSFAADIVPLATSTPQVATTPAPAAPAAAAAAAAAVVVAVAPAAAAAAFPAKKVRATAAFAAASLTRARRCRRVLFFFAAFSPARPLRSSPRRLASSASASR